MALSSPLLTPRKKRINITVDQRTHDRLKALSRLVDINLSAYFNECLQELLKVYEGLESQLDDSMTDEERLFIARRWLESCAEQAKEEIDASVSSMSS